MFPNLLTEMKRKRYSQKGLAEFIGITERSMTKKMNGKTEFTLREMRAVQMAFPECSLDYLFVQYSIEA